VTKTTAKKKTKAKAKKHTEAEYQELKAAATALARCAVTTLQSDGKIGVGSGMTISVDPKTKEKRVRHWSTQFFDALDMVGIVYDREAYLKGRK
jgi:hypothetical protein